MNSVDDLIDESVWINVQDPVRQMIAAITKAVRTQSAGIRDLDRKIVGLVTKDMLERTVGENMATTCSKHEAKDMVREIDARSNEMKSNFLNYEDKLFDITNKINKMNEVVNHQNIAVTNINSRMEKMADDIDELKMNPNYDAIYAYIDRQVSNCYVCIDYKFLFRFSIFVYFSIN